ncbi:MAG: LuxR C-terminal-related transcriptional regulator [Paludibacteraceae bacterium]|nr:LuxR C-terminal-related transcriptional regulator [Paludibacteraceae bacterium]
MKKLCIAIIESSNILIEGLAKVLENGVEFKIAKIFRSPANPQNLVLNNIDILIVNPRFFGENQITKYLHDWREENEELNIVALQTSYLSSPISSLFDAIIELDDDNQTILGKLKNLASKEISNETSESFELSSREKDVLVAIAKGLQNKEIADQLNISVYTVMAHRKNITKKTGIKSIAGLTVYALLNNLLSQSDIK